MLHFNQDNIDAEEGWKVLIYDKLGQDIISPLLKVGDLREHGVTIHMYFKPDSRALHSDRQRIADVPAVYFVEPTFDNIKRISEDMANGLYDSFNLNFSSTLPRPLLEEFATYSSSTASLVSQVYDQYLNFISLESNLFSLRCKNSYALLNDPHTTESALETLTDHIASALFSVCVTMSTFNLIRNRAHYSMSKGECSRGCCSQTRIKTTGSYQ